MILRVGLTGGIASGKSTIARYFAELGCDVYDADALVAELYQPGQAGHEALVRTYGGGILRADGEINRKALSDIAFSSPAEAQKLNALIHPIVLEEEARRVASAEAANGGDHIAIIEATLLLEAGAKTRYDRIVVVDVPREVQIARGVGRGMARGEVERRIANQMSREERLANADYVVDNSGGEAQARAETERVFESLRRDLRDKRERA